MEEKLLALLVAKFVGVPDAILKRIAAKKAGSVTDESQLQSVADGIDYGQIVQSEIDSKITEANKKAIQNYEATHKLKDGKPVVESKPGSDDPDDIATIVANAVKTAIEPLQSKIATIEGSKTTETRQQKLEALLKDVPAAFKSKSLKDFKRMSFETEDAFDEYLTEVGTDITALNQEIATRNFEAQSVPRFSKNSATEEEEFAAAMASINETQANN